MKTSVFDKICLLFILLVASYEVVKGMKNYDNLSILFFTIGFGVIIIASLLILIFNFEILTNRFVIVAAALIPMSFAIAIVKTYYSKYYSYYMIFALISFLLIIITRFTKEKILSVLSIIIGHGIAGLIIVFLPFIMFISGKADSNLLFISIGGALIGIGGGSLAFLKAGKPILSEKTIFTILLPILFLTTLFFALGI